jgi:DmsE family decaheme c-type cytochrome
LWETPTLQLRSLIVKTRRGCQQIASCGIAVLSLVMIHRGFAAGQEEKKAVAQQSESAKYLGSETCKTCHEEIYQKKFENTPHFKASLDPAHGCEACHGPGSAHVDGGGDVSKIVSFKTMSRKESSARCLTCHGEKHEQRHFSASAHASNDVGCLDCHSPHNAKEPEHLLAQAQPSLCYGCHTAAKADFGKPYHHRVDEGLIRCSDCHNVHGTTTLRQVRAMPSGDAVCAKCHADKAGPFVYEHVPVKTEGCSSCHTPHGSTNPRFLRVSQVNLLCLQYQACTMCHAAIHGSNASNVFFR